MTEEENQEGGQEMEDPIEEIPKEDPIIPDQIENSQEKEQEIEEPPDENPKEEPKIQEPIEENPKEKPEIQNPITQEQEQDPQPPKKEQIKQQEQPKIEENPQSVKEIKQPRVQQIQQSGITNQKKNNNSNFLEKLNLNYDYNLPYFSCPFSLSHTTKENIPICCCCSTGNPYHSLNCPIHIYSPQKEELKYKQLSTEIPKIIDRTKNQTSKSPKVKSHPCSISKEKFSDYLKKVMQVEAEIEERKRRLAENKDFNCEDCFRLFEFHGLDFLTRYDVSQGLNKLSIFPRKEDLDIFMNRYDLWNDGKIDFGIFCDIVTTFKKEARDEIFGRMPNNVYSYNSNLSKKTLEEIRELFIDIIVKEKIINQAKKNLKEINLDEVFPGIGMFDRKISHNEFFKYLKDNGLLNDKKNAELLFFRLDRNRDGKIHRDEIIHEIRPVYLFGMENKIYS